jgi:hypothetical protein
MRISRQAFDRKPLFIRQGALQLWGTLLARRVDSCRVRELYWYSDFYCELCYDTLTGKPTCVCSFSKPQRLALYLDSLSVAELTPNYFQ